MESCVSMNSQETWRTFVNVGRLCKCDEEEDPMMIQRGARTGNGVALLGVNFTLL